MGEAARFLSPASVAEMFDVSKSTVTRWEAKGIIKPVVIGGRMKRYDVSDLLRSAGQALDVQAGGNGNVVDVDEATRRMMDARRQKDRQKAAR